MSLLLSMAPAVFDAAKNTERMDSEKQISVDPISLKESSTDLNLPPPLPPTQFKFLSCSLPNSANSSPKFSIGETKKKVARESLLKVSNSNRERSLQEENHFMRSKSCGEGRASAPSDDLDLWLNKPNAKEINKKFNGSFSKTEGITKSNIKNVKKAGTASCEDQFKCGALCLFIPGRGKGKPVRGRKEDQDEEESEMGKMVISRTVSLEKFECGSWASSAAMVNENGEEGDSTSLYFDLPMELIRKSVDSNTPVNAAFVFEKDRKGVLKNGSSTKSTTNRKSNESPRHVQFSTTSSSSSTPSSPAATCITPRLRKAREEFNAFLEAQSA